MSPHRNCRGFDFAGGRGDAQVEAAADHVLRRQPRGATGAPTRSVALERKAVANSFHFIFCVYFGLKCQAWSFGKGVRCGHLSRYMCRGSATAVRRSLERLLSTRVVLLQRVIDELVFYCRFLALVR